MDNKKTNSYYINKVLEHLNNIVDYLHDKADEEFFGSKILKSAICFEFV